MPDTAAPPNDRVNTPLLTLITQQSLDEDYRHVADRKALEPGAQRRTSGIAAIVVAVFGVLVTVAALQTQQGEDVRSASRTTLITQIDEGRANLSELQRRIVRLRELNVGLQSHRDEVTSDQLGAEARVQRLAASTGFGAVTGPGVKITVDDNPDGTLVRDRDLRPAVNGLWQAGAEAIAVNGNRLTARSAIRNSGIAIRVNNRSLSPPYVITAIGNENTLQANLMQTTSGLVFRNTVESLGFPWSMDNADQLFLPAAPPRIARLRSAEAGTAEQNQNQHRKEAPQ
ncbi:DUF881 domain-containing protein [Nocardioides sp. URHA0032]|uniref:DUF881 domain-containing protein n=1 Tax=Nocardioides sp. URHA0032 TaxID=1380388 RepID=UPI0006841CB3|nr:DUF881 domain-containing protein [Nocardioides sp. URHA0032]